MESNERGLREILDHWYHVNNHAEVDLLAWARAYGEAVREACNQTARTFPNVTPSEIAKHKDEREKQFWVQGWLSGNADAARRIRGMQLPEPKP